MYQPDSDCAKVHPLVGHTFITVRLL